MFNFVMKRGARNLARDFIEVFDQIRQIHPDKPRAELLKILTARFKSSPSNYLEYDNLLQDQSFWEKDPSLRIVILELVCLHLFNARINGSLLKRWFNAAEEGVDEIIKSRNEPQA